jgi:uncharacterized membrane protein YgaE (UPF0421/DUF939 family)
VAWTGLIQLVKTVAACVLAWVVAVHVFSLPQAFLAPWSALLVVHATVYRTFSQGAQQVGATVLGVVLAWAVGNLLGLDPVAMTVVVLAGLLAGYLPRLPLDGTSVAATAVIVLAIGGADDHRLLLFRFVDTAVGIVVGLVVNLLVWPPLRDLSAARALDAVDTEVGVLLRDMASELRDVCQEENVQDWVDRTREIDSQIDRAWSLARQAHESARFNPRRRARVVRESGQYRELLHRTEQAVAEIRSMARTIGHSITNVTEWEPVFHSRWTRILDDAGDAIIEADGDRLARLRQDLLTLAEELSTDRLSGLHWSEYGGLILNVRNIAAAMDRVAGSRPVTPESRQPASPLLRE